MTDRDNVTEHLSPTERAFLLYMGKALADIEAHLMQHLDPDYRPVDDMPEQMVDEMRKAMIEIGKDN